MAAPAEPTMPDPGEAPEGAIPLTEPPSRAEMIVGWTVCIILFLLVGAPLCLWVGVHTWRWALR